MAFVLDFLWASQLSLILVTSASSCWPPLATPPQDTGLTSACSARAMGLRAPLNTVVATLANGRPTVWCSRPSQTTRAPTSKGTARRSWPRRKRALGPPLRCRRASPSEGEAL